MRRTCFKCLKDIFPSITGDFEDNLQNPPSDATFWTTYGNYGSTVHDSNEFYLEIYICDECLVASRATIYKVKERTSRDLEFEEWKK